MKITSLEKLFDMIYSSGQLLIVTPAVSLTAFPDFHYRLLAAMNQLPG